MSYLRVQLFVVSDCSRKIEIRHETEEIRSVLDARQQLLQRHAEEDFEELGIEIVESVVLGQQIHRAAGKLLHDHLQSELPILDTYEYVQE